MEEELLRKILEKLENIDEKLELISDRLNKPLPVILQEKAAKKPSEDTRNVIITQKKD